MTDRSSYAAGRRICVASGMDAELRNRVRTLRSLRKGLRQTLRELDRAVDSYSIARAGEVTALLVRSACDLTMSIIAPSPAVSFGYAQAMLLLEAVTGQVDTKKAVEHSTGAKLDAISEHLGQNGQKGAGKILSTLQQMYAIAGTLKTISDGAGGGSGLHSARLTLRNQINTLSDKIARIETELEAEGCDTRLIIGPTK